MDRKKFIKRSALGLGILPLAPLGTILKDQETCEATPKEIAGPFPNKRPKDYITENIVGDRKGIPLLINFKVQNVNDNCSPLESMLVDIWQCDSQGNYSEYRHQLDGNFTGSNFLRGRQTTDSNGNVSFVSIYPGWYPGRSPHLHVEVLTKKEKSVLITQIAFPEDISKKVYESSLYNGVHDTPNRSDYEFRDSLKHNLTDSLSGNVSDGYVLNKIIKVKV